MGIKGTLASYSIILQEEIYVFSWLGICENWAPYDAPKNDLFMDILFLVDQKGGTTFIHFILGLLPQ